MNSALEDVLGVLRTVALEVDAAGNLQLLSPLPGWYSAAWSDNGSGPLDRPEDHPFFENFLVHANEFWEAAQSDRLASGPWVDEAHDGSEIHLEAFAFLRNRRRLLFLKQLGSEFQERLDLLQKARENHLIHERLVKEIQQKEILLHCIVHDLAGPLTGISAALSLVAKEPLSEAGQRRLEIGQRATSQLADLIRDILEVFSAEVEELRGRTPQPGQDPDLVACARRVVETLSPAGVLRGVGIELSGSGLSSPLYVAAEGDRLERLLYNLIQNAVRHAPPDSTVRVVVDEENEGVRVRVEDDGPGVAPDLEKSLFQKLIRGEGKRGKAGLGLYFCRIMAERWNGSIGYEPGAGGGAVFWLVLQRGGSQPPHRKDHGDL